MEQQPERGRGRGSARLVVISALAALLGLLACAAAWVHYRNELVALDVATETQWKQVENALQRQHDLIPNLVKVTLGYARHEREVLIEIVETRSRIGELPAEERVKAAVALDKAIAHLLAVAEDHPNLKADRQYRELQFELAGAQNRIAVERRRYNELAGLYNARLRMIPWRLAAFGFSERAFYSAEADALETPILDL